MSIYVALQVCVRRLLVSPTVSAMESAPPPDPGVASTETAGQTGQLVAFDGPLDLLLELITRRDLEITSVSLAAVTQQYLEEVGRLQSLDLERLSGYLVIASRLLLLKSQALLPRPAPPAEEDEGVDLVRQLEEYQQYKQLAAGFKLLEEAGQRAYAREAISLPQTSLAPGAGRPVDLTSALKRALLLAPSDEQTVDAERPRFTVVEKLFLLRERLIIAETVSFSALVSTASSRQEVVVLFLAMLELLRRGEATVTQEALFAPILLTKTELMQLTEEQDADDGASDIDKDIEW